jgi:ACR3 family arsenite efflux pump ArsB
MGKTVTFDIKILIQSIIRILLIPLISANMIKLMVRKIKLDRYFNKILDKNDTIQFILLCFVIISMFASQGSILLANSIIFIKILSPLIIFFIMI